MNGRNGPMSPVSIGGSEWSGITKYNDSGAPYSPAGPNSRGQLASPPVSNSSNGTMNGGYPPRVDSGGPPPNGNPSPPSSVGRSSIGTGLYARSEAGDSRRDEQFEAVLSEHYVALRRYLARSLREEKENPKPNRARDKLLRLSSVQFQELSTDVFDELLRRQQSSRRAANGPGMPNEPEAPPYLLPVASFHPKRNQARQKLSTLSGARFKDLATDVFYELERRFPHFTGDGIPRIGSPASIRRPPSRSQTGTPMSGMREPGRMRRPSNASSIAYSVRSESRGGPRPPMNGMNNIPPSPRMPPNDYGRPTPKTFQSNTIVPNKSTMVEDESGAEDNDDDDGDAFGLESAARNRDSKKSLGGSETDKKLIDDYQAQVAELREKLDAMEDTINRKDEELKNALEEKERAMADDSEIKRLEDLKIDLETKLADVQNLNESLQSELDRVRTDHATTERDLRAQIEELKEGGGNSQGPGDTELARENEELRAELREQQQVTDEVRREAQEALQEMRLLSERSTSSYEREDQLTAMVEKLEQEVKDWRNRYARTKTQLRGLRATSMGLQIPNAGRYTKDNGFTEENGLVKDVHVTKFQISIDELLRVARTEEPSKVMDYLKVVVVNVRNITKDIDEAHPENEELAAQRTKLKSRVSATANNLTTAARNFSYANGYSPISLLDAAASHLTTSVVELIRTVKIRPTPAGELEDDDDGTLQPATGLFPVKEAQEGGQQAPPYLGLRNGRASGGSSMYTGSPHNSPRQSVARPGSSGHKRGMSSRGSLGRNSLGGILNGNDRSPAPMGVGFGIRTQSSDVEELKVYLEDETASLVQNIQALVSSIRSESNISVIASQITSIADVVQSVVSSTEEAMASANSGELRSQGDPVLKRLIACRAQLLEAKEIGHNIAEEGIEDDEGASAWGEWKKTLPPIAFEIARETKELVLKVDVVDGETGRGGDDDFS
ncbi:hypothetical protein F5884DRAFT_672598 [Xylogone sp. PMI_703]|nr:hypothetical protein F5884DRAFT_672598 [Xylogone sp. PMI_703]